MSLIKYIHSSLKFICLAFLSITHSFNYLNHITFILLSLKEKEKIEKSYYVYIIIYFIIYEIMKYASNNITIKFIKFIGDHVYYSFSICILAVINLIFSFFSFSYSSILVYILYRIFISLFNNIASYIDLPISLLYTKKEFHFKKRNFSFLQKVSNFLFFISFLLFFKYSKNFNFYCFFLAFLNLICFIFTLIILGCNKENIYNKYYPNVAEKETFQLKEKNRKNSKVNKEEVPNKNTNDIGIKIDNPINISNSSSVHNNNITTNMNNTENYMKQQQNLILNQANNSIKIEDQPANENRGGNNSQTWRGFLFPFLFLDNNTNQNLYPQKIKIVIGLLIVFVVLKCLNFLSLFMLIFKSHEIKLFSFIVKSNELLFPEISSFLNITSVTEEYILLFTCYYFLNIFLYLINMSYTSCAIKKKCINYAFYYSSVLLIFVSNIFFVYYYLKKTNEINTDKFLIRSNIIFLFLLNLVMNECSMIMSVYYNIKGKESGFVERTLKEIKSLSVFFAGILFSLIQILIAVISSDTNSFEKYFYFIIFISFILIIYFISLLFL